jgi:hypothetical protein
MFQLAILTLSASLRISAIAGHPQQGAARNDAISSVE